MAPFVGSCSGRSELRLNGGVLFDGWRRGSDALGALAWPGLCINLAASRRFVSEGARPSQKQSSRIIQRWSRGFYDRWDVPHLIDGGASIPVWRSSFLPVLRSS